MARRSDASARGSEPSFTSTPSAMRLRARSSEAFARSRSISSAFSPASQISDSTLLRISAKPSVTKRSSVDPLVWVMETSPGRVAVSNGRVIRQDAVAAVDAHEGHAPDLTVVHRPIRCDDAQVQLFFQCHGRDLTCPWRARRPRRCCRPCRTPAPAGRRACPRGSRGTSGPCPPVSRTCLVSR